MEFVYIPAGTFMMGSPLTETDRSNDEILHQVTLTRGFWMQTTQVTQAQWKRVMGMNPSEFKENGKNSPVENVTWILVQNFIQKLNQMETGEEVAVAVRPEKIQILSNETDAQGDIINRFSGRIEEIVYVGEARIYRINLAAGLIVEVKVQSGPDSKNYKIGGDITIGWRTHHGLALT